MHETNRYKNLEKQAAYEAALKLASGSELTNLAKAEIALIISVRHNLGIRDARQVAAKAVRVERGRRRKETK